MSNQTSPLSLSSLVANARECIRRTWPGTQEYAVFSAVIDLLGESQPCHIEAPEIMRHSTSGERLVFIPTEWGNRSIDPDDAEHMARMLFRAADNSRAADRSGEE